MEELAPMLLVYTSIFSWRYCTAQGKIWWLKLERTEVHFWPIKWKIPKVSQHYAKHISHTEDDAKKPMMIQWSIGTVSTVYSPYGKDTAFPFLFITLFIWFWLLACYIDHEEAHIERNKGVNDEFWQDLKRTSASEHVILISRRSGSVVFWLSRWKYSTLSLSGQSLGGVLSVLFFFLFSFLWCLPSLFSLPLHHLTSSFLFLRSPKCPKY